MGEWQGGFQDKDEQFLFGHCNASAEQASEGTCLGSQEKQGWKSKGRRDLHVSVDMLA